MKILLTGFILVFTTTFLTAQELANNPVPDNTEITWQTVSKDVGKVPYNEDLSVEYKYTNSGNKPLIINNVRTSCGCTVGNYSKKPLPPGESDVITVSYDTKRPGKFSKTISVYSNASEELSKLTISGEVVQ